MKEMLEQIILTLEGVEVKGKSNIEKMFCCFAALEQLINELNNPQEDTDNG